MHWRWKLPCHKLQTMGYWPDTFSIRSGSRPYNFHCRLQVRTHSTRSFALNRSVKRMSRKRIIEYFTPKLIQNFTNENEKVCSFDTTSTIWVICFAFLWGIFLITLKLSAFSNSQHPTTGIIRLISSSMKLFGANTRLHWWLHCSRVPHLANTSEPQEICAIATFVEILNLHVVPWDICII